MALPARAFQCQYENSGTPAFLISHALNEILALGIPRYTYGQLVATAFFCIVGKEIQSKYRKKTRHKTECSLRTCSRTGRDHSLSATRYIPHSPVRLHSPHTAPYKFTQPRGYPPCSVDGSHSHRSIIYIFAIAVILCNEYESFAVNLQLQLLLVSARPRVFRSSRSIATLVFTAPPSRSSKLLFLSICSFEI